MARISLEASVKVHLGIQDGLLQPILGSDAEGGLMDDRDLYGARDQSEYCLSR